MPRSIRCSRRLPGFTEGSRHEWFGSLGHHGGLQFFRVGCSSLTDPSLRIVAASKSFVMCCQMMGCTFMGWSLPNASGEFVNRWTSIFMITWTNI